MATEERIQLGIKRITNVLKKHDIAIFRTLEQKISDSGPNNQRVDPHALTTAKNRPINDKQLIQIKHGETHWYHLPKTPISIVNSRLEEQEEIYLQLQSRNIPIRIGQALEIAVFRALREQKMVYLGHFTDLDAHDDSETYQKQEPSSHLGIRSLSGKQKLDFLLLHPEAGWAGIEVKNVREWMYPDRKDIKELLSKCITLDCVPIFIARRIHYLTFKLFSQCGVVFHQTYNHLLPESEKPLADKAKDKRLLGFHDIRLGNKPDKRLMKFICENLSKILPKAREKFENHKSILKSYTSGKMMYEDLRQELQYELGESLD